MFINDYYVNNTPFVELALGETFYSEQESDYFMATQEVISDTTKCVLYNAVSLTTGYLEYFEDSSIVKKIRGEFRVK